MNGFRVARKNWRFSFEAGEEFGSVLKLDVEGGEVRLTLEDVQDRCEVELVVLS